MHSSIHVSPTPIKAEPEPFDQPVRRFQLVRQLLGTPSGAIGLAIVTLYVLVAIAGATGLTPHSPFEQYRADRLQGPSREYWMGTDLLGRDLFSRVVKGGTNSLIVVLSSVGLSALFGTAIGVASAWSGGLLDNVAMRVMDVFFAFPAILLALLVVTILGAGLRNTIFAIAIVYTPIFARVARGPVLSLKETEFVDAATALGLPSWRILLRHVLPNTVAPTIVQISLALSWALLTEAGLSFLGLGTPPPEPSWGQMLSDSTGIAEVAPWLLLFPGMAIMISVLGFNLLGDSLRDALDPRLKR